MPTAALPHIQKTDVLVTIPQKEIEAEIDPSKVAAATGGGLLFALIDTAVNNARANSAEQAIIPLRNELLDLNLNESVKKAITTNIVIIPWVADEEIELTNALTNDQLDAKFLASDKSALLVLAINYRISPDFKTLKLYGHANLFPKNDELKKLQFDLYKDTSKINEPTGVKMIALNSLYRNSFTYSKTIQTKSNDLSDIAKEWSENNGSKLRAAMNEGIESLIKALAQDLQATIALQIGQTNPVPVAEEIKIVTASKTLTANRTTAGALLIQSVD